MRIGTGRAPWLLAVTLILSFHPPARAADEVARGSRRYGYREFFQAAMRSRDLHRWREALILFGEARKLKPTEGERIRFYGRRRFPIYAPRFYIAEALFKIGEHSRALEIWKEYEPGGRHEGLVARPQRKKLAQYRAEYDLLLPAAVDSLTAERRAASAALDALDARTKDLDAERWAETVARRRRSGACRTPTALDPAESAGPLDGPALIKELRSCLSRAQDLLKLASSPEDPRLFEAHELIETVTIDALDLQRALRLSPAVPAKGGTPWTRLRGPYRLVGDRVENGSSRRWTLSLDIPPVQPTLSALPDLETYAERHALVIGVSKYKSPRDVLKTENEVKAVEDALRALNYKVTPVPNPPDRAALEKAISHFLESAGRNERNQILIYYAGHGITVWDEEERVSAGYLVPIGAAAYDPDDPAYNSSDAKYDFMHSAVGFDFLFTEVRKINSRHAFFVFDSCFSGQIFRDGSKAQLVHSPRRSREEADDDPCQYFLRNSVRWFLTSARPKQRAEDDATFSSAFVKGLQREEERPDCPGFVTGEELSKFIRQTVMKKHGGAQVPDYGNIGVVGSSGQVVFRPVVPQ